MHPARTIHPQAGRIRLFAVLLALLFVPAELKAAESRAYNSFPETIDRAAKYLIYLHGRNVELKNDGRTPPGPNFDFAGIKAAFVALGFTVIAESRTADTLVPHYARHVAEQVRRLMASGVAPRNIVVAGYSKGGAIALFAAALHRASDLRTIVMAGCGREGSPFGSGYAKFLAQLAPRLEGRLLSIYDEADDKFGTCGRAFAAAPQAAGEEVVVRTGRGHFLFYTPQAAWLDPVKKWLDR